MYTADMISAVQYVAHRGDNFVIEYLYKIEAEFENTLACLLGAQMGSKTGSRKSRDTLPFKDRYNCCFSNKVLGWVESAHHPHTVP